MTTHLHTYAGHGAVAAHVEATDAESYRGMISDNDSYLEWGEPRTGVNAGTLPHVVLEYGDDEDARRAYEILRAAGVPVDATDGDDWSTVRDWSAPRGAGPDWWTANAERRRAHGMREV